MAARILTRQWLGEAAYFRQHPRCRPDFIATLKIPAGIAEILPLHRLTENTFPKDEVARRAWWAKQERACAPIFEANVSQKGFSIIYPNIGGCQFLRDQLLDPSLRFRLDEFMVTKETIQKYRMTIYTEWNADRRGYNVGIDGSPQGRDDFSGPSREQVIAYLAYFSVGEGRQTSVGCELDIIIAGPDTPIFRP